MNVCLSTKLCLEVMKLWHGEDEEEVGEAEVGLGPDLGPEEDRSATCRLGRGPVGSLATVGDLD